MEDNLYPSSGAYRPQELAKRKREAKNEEAQAAQMLPLIKDIVKRFEERVTYTDSVKNALTIAEKYKISKENALIVLDVLNDEFSYETNELKGMIDDFTR